VPYRIVTTRRAAKDLAALPRAMARRIDEEILSLAEVPRPAEAVKLKGADALYRVRVGDYRIVYEVQDDVVVIVIARVGHRREVYRGL
jgi:mRNA interferase RelE/StbE